MNDNSLNNQNNNPEPINIPTSNEVPEPIIIPQEPAINSFNQASPAETINNEQPVEINNNSVSLASSPEVSSFPAVEQVINNAPDAISINQFSTIEQPIEQNNNPDPQPEIPVSPIAEPEINTINPTIAIDPVQETPTVPTNVFNEQPQNPFPTTEPVQENISADNNKKLDTKKMILAGIVVVIAIALIVVMLLLFSGKKYVCTMTDSINGMNMSVKTILNNSKNGIKAHLEMSITKEGEFSEDEIESFKNSYSDNEEYKITTSKNKITVKYDTIEDDFDSLEEAKKDLEKSGFTCK